MDFAANLFLPNGTVAISCMQIPVLHRHRVKDAAPLVTVTNAMTKETVSSLHVLALQMPFDLI